MSELEATTARPLILETQARSDNHRLVVEAVQALVILVDGTLVWATAVAGHVVWTGEFEPMSTSIAAATPLAILTALFFLGYMGLRRGFSAGLLSEPDQQLRMVTVGWLFAFFTLGWLGFLTKATAEFSRVAVTLHFFFGFIALTSVHVGGAAWLSRRFESGRLSLRRVSVIAVTDARGVERILSKLASRGLEVISVTAIPATSLGKSVFPSLCRAAATDVRTAMARVKLDGVYLFVSWRDRRRIDELREVLGPMAVPVYLFADRETAALIERPTVRLGRLCGFEIERAPLTRVDRMLKRSLDVVVASIAIAVLAPVMALTALGILVETGRPVLFRQTRRGFGGRPFEILKFRTMTVQENGDVVTQARRGDARITRLGYFLRKSSLDELPQLVNVLRGDMSLVGPRPHAVVHDDHYGALIATYAVRHHVKPGITGWAQINGCRGETREIDQMTARIDHDLWYIGNWSIWLDIRIIARTAFKVWLDPNAY